MRLAFVFVSGLVLAVAGCSESKPEAAECAGTKDCDPGFICRDGACEQICAGDSDCASGRICVADICKVGEREDAPAIRSIDGNGNEDVAGGLHAAHHFADAVVLGGEYFTGATVELIDAASRATRLVAEGTDTELTMELPTDLVAGDYTIRAMNAAGADQVTVSILQGERGPPGSADLIAATATLNVGPNSEFADINAALDSLNGMVIPSGVTITIQVENGNHTYDAPVVIDHANGERIRIVGNESNADSVVLTFNGCNGFSIGGARLGRLSGFRIVGDGTTPGATGILLRRGAVVQAGDALKTVGWGGSGVIVTEGSSFHGGAMHSSGNAAYGFSARQNSFIDVRGSTAEGNGATGYHSADSSELSASNSIAANNGYYGYLAERGSVLMADLSTANSNRYGFAAHSGATLFAMSSHAVDNAGHGFSASAQSLIQAGRIAALDNPTAERNGHTESYGSGFFASTGSTILATDSIATDNFSSGYLAQTNATVTADRGQALGNGAHGLLCELGSTCSASSAVADGNGPTTNGHGFAALDNSTLRGNNAEARNNGGGGFHATNGSVIQARNAVACGNGATNFLPATGNTDFAASSNGAAIDASDVVDLADCP